MLTKALKFPSLGTAINLFDPGQSQKQMQVVRKHEEPGVEGLYCRERLIDLLVNLAQVQVGVQRRLVLQGRLELPLCISVESEPAGANSRFDGLIVLRFALAC